MKKNLLKEAFSARGLSCRDAARLGLKYPTVWVHLHGKRNIGPRSALLYESVLGIPRSELRPDLWPPHEPSPGPSAEERV